MTLVLVHHAEAESPAVDPHRPLTARGLIQAASLAAELEEAGVRPAAIWHSGKLRARQTAEAFLRRVPVAECRMVRGLRPDDPVDWIRHEIEAETRDLLIVGHMPGLSELARVLAPSCAGVPLHGLVCLDRTDDGAWQERRGSGH